MTNDLVVVGEGIAGLTCAAEAAKLGLRTATFEAGFLGGLVVNVNELHRFDEADGLSGMDHAAMLANANKKAGVTSVQAEVREIRPVDGGFEVDTGSGKFTSRFVVIATGARLKKLGVPGEADYEGRGVSQCADCDAPMFTGAEVVVAGAGDWALQDAMVLAQECSIVNVVHEGEALVACPDYISAALAEPKIRFHAATAIEEVLGNENGMTGLRLRDGHGARREFTAAGLFVMSGLDANGGLAPAQVGRDEQGYLQVSKNLKTAVPGLWAIGLARSGFGGWLADAAADARRVAHLVKACMG